MKRISWIFISLTFLLLTACRTKPTEQAEEPVPQEYGAAQEAARAAFSDTFRDFEDLNVTETRVGRRSDGSELTVVQFAYTSLQGGGEYTLVMEKTEDGSWAVREQGSGLNMTEILTESDQEDYRSK